MIVNFSVHQMYVSETFYGVDGNGSSTDEVSLLMPEIVDRVELDVPSEK